MRETSLTQRYHDASHLMHPVSAPLCPQARTSGFLLAFESFADELCGTLARLFAYVGVLALIGILAVVGWQQFVAVDAVEPSATGWSLADGAVPAYALRLSDQPDKSATYAVLRHPDGGRKDVIRWGEADRPPARTEIEVYRFGAEGDRAPDANTDLARRMAVKYASALEAAGVIESKFGTVRLVRLAGAVDGPGACLGFVKAITTPAMRLSGWSCRGGNGQIRRAVVGCMLNRLTLLAAGHDSDLTSLFARTEAKRTACDPTVPGAAAMDWMTAADDPRLRGAL
jgi:hypothetical protein